MCNEHRERKNTFVYKMSFGVLGGTIMIELAIPFIIASVVFVAFLYVLRLVNKEVVN